MPSPNNLRIIHQNQVDLSTTSLSASSTAVNTSIANLKSDRKSKIWRSTSGSQSSIIIDLGTPKNIGGIVLAFCNLSSSATIKVTGYNSPYIPSFIGNTISTIVPATYTVSATSCCPWNNLNLTPWISNPVGSSNYSYGGGTHARVWLNDVQAATPVRHLGIEITDSGSGNTYIEVSRIIAGSYWSPKYNTGYGIESGIKDLSEHFRTEGGDMLTRLGPRVRTLNFDLQWLADEDRKELTKILLASGMSRPIFTSIFPESTGLDEDFQREGIHQIYGKMVSVPGVSYTSYSIYSTKIELEEV